MATEATQEENMVEVVTIDFNDSTSSLTLDKSSYEAMGESIKGFCKEYQVKAKNIAYVRPHKVTQEYYDNMPDWEG